MDNEIKRKLYYWPIAGAVVAKYVSSFRNKAGYRGDSASIGVRYISVDIHMEGEDFFEYTGDKLEEEESVIGILNVPPECYVVCCEYTVDDVVIGWQELGIQWAGKKTFKIDWEDKALQLQKFVIDKYENKIKDNRA